MNLKNLFLVSTSAALAILATAPKSYSQDSLAEADQAYQQGDCAKAIPIYHAMLRNPQLPVGEERNGILFKLSYCYLNQGNFEGARIGFGEYLKYDRQNLEAQLRYSQSLVQLKSYRPALSALDQVSNPGGFAAEWNYWRGMALYQLKSYEDSKKAFILCYQKSGNGDWSRDACRDWVKHIKEDKILPFSVVRGGLGYFTDSNVGKTGTQYTYVTTTAPVSKSSTSESTAYVVSDTGYTSKLGLDLNFVQDPTGFSLTSSFDGSMSQYNKYKAYSQEYLTFQTKAGLYLDDGWMSSLTLGLIDSRYKFHLYQDYWSIEPSVTRFPNENSSLVFALPFTHVFKGTASTTYGGKFSYLWYPDGDYFELDFSGSRTTGDKAVMSGTVPTYSTGSEFANYNTFSTTLVYSTELDWKVYIAPAVSLYYTMYDKENIPAGVTYYENQPARTDVTIAPGLSFSRVLFTPKLRLTLSGTYTINSSSGYQGVASTYGVISSQSYKRAYFSADVSFYF